jgi:riboflavin kinase
MKIKGRIVEGLGEGRHFTRISWVREQCMSKLAIDPFPGTLNLEISDPADLESFEQLKQGEGVVIHPEDPSFCSGKCFPVLIGGRLKGAIVLPVVEGYPKNKMELITALDAKEALSVQTGDMLEVEILMPSPSRATS